MISDHMRQRAESMVRKLSSRAPFAVDAIVRFETDGPTRRVEITLHEARRRIVVGEGTSRNYGPALAAAAAKVAAQLAKEKRNPKGRKRGMVQT
ncbi:MAG: HPF/RaiA family ribosome-associated protein [Gemmatimonadota bacterium]|nr:HPF/RaiA family ribosome-associated protein [Gemmatimonadota bacterium]